MSDVEILATVRLRLARVVAARKALGWSQPRLAAEAGVNIHKVRAIEALDFSRKTFEDDALKICVALKIPTDDVLPADLAGFRAETTTFQTTKKIPVQALLDYKARQDKRLLIEGPGNREDLDRDALEAVLKKGWKRLTPRERIVLDLRYGLHGQHYQYTLNEVAKILNRTRERVRQAEMHAIRKLQHPDISKPLEKIFWQTPDYS